MVQTVNNIINRPGTTERRTLDLCGEIHPVFANWTHVDDSALHEELQQPLLLASKILEAVGRKQFLYLVFFLRS